MHILFVTGEYPPMPGGVGAYTAELGRTLVDLGVQVSVLTSTSAATTIPIHPAIPVYAEVVRWNWRIWSRVPTLATQIGAEWVHVQYQTAAFGMNPAINLAPDVWHMAGQQPRKFKTAWSYHDLLVPYLFPKAGSWLRRWITERPALTSDLVVTTNQGDWQQLAGRARHLLNIPIGSNIAGQTLAPAERAAQRLQRGYGSNDFVIGYFGFLNRSKGGLTLVQTLAALIQAGRNAQLLMIGERVGASDPTNQAYLQEVEALITTLGLQNRVQWTGYLPDTGVSAALNTCDVLCLPYADGASLRRGTLMAALAHGCAVVTTLPQSPLPELVAGRDLLYTPPGDAPAAALALAQLMDSQALVDQLRHNALRASQQFTWATIAQQHVGGYGTNDK